jgi:SET domain-containing protein
MKPRINPDYTWFDLEIVRSPIHRWGVVTKQNIPKRRYVIEYTGQLLSRRHHKAVTGKRRHCFTYCLDNYWSLDGAVRGSGAERVNHSCNPNLYAQIIGHRVYFYSIRRIKKGEELTVDYCFEYSKTPVPCLCGSKKCRGIINMLKGQTGRQDETQPHSKTC